MLRKLIAGATAALVPLGALCAPFVHAHLDDHDTPHHHGHEIHAHLFEHDAPPARPPNGTAIDHEDDSERAVAMLVFVAVSPNEQSAPALPATPFVVLASWTPAPRPLPQVSHGHDPPVPSPLAPRPPPARVI